MYQQIVRKNFLCREKSTDDPHAVKEGIQTPTGDVFIGYDVWRLLDYMDYPSYGYEIYSAFDFSKKFDIIEDYIVIREHPRPVKKKTHERPVKKHVNWHAYL